MHTTDGQNPQRLDPALVPSTEEPPAGEERASVDLLTIEALFRASPTPTVSQDYTFVMAWMRELRDNGLTDFEAFLDEDPTRIVSGACRIIVTAANDAAVQVTGIEEVQ